VSQQISVLIGICTSDLNRLELSSSSR